MSRTPATNASGTRRALAACALLVTAACSQAHGEEAQPWNPLKRELPELRDGISAYNDSKWADAEKKFDDANAKQPSSEGHFDEAAALYRQKKLSDASEQLRKVLSSTDDDLKERAYFDLGNAEAAGGDLEKAKVDYRRALELRPRDADARYNLEWASRALQKQKEEAKNDHKGGQNDKQSDKKDGDKGDKKNDKKDDQKQANNDNKDDQKKDDAKKDDPKKDQSGDKKDQQANNDKKDQPDKDGQQEKADDKSQQKGDQQAQNDQPQPKPDDGQKGDQKDQQQGQAGQQGDPKQAQGAQAQNDKNAPDQQARPMSQQETASVLDALQADEHSLQMWKFEQKKTHPRSTLEKDW